MRAERPALIIKLMTDIVGVAKATLGNGMRPDGQFKTILGGARAEVMSSSCRAALDRQRRIPKGVT